MKKIILAAIILMFSNLLHNLYSQICVGTQGEVTWSYWRNLPDDTFGELYADEYYNKKPDGTRILNSLLSPQNFDNYFGSVMRGFITTTSTESVEFNITGDDNTLFYLSTDDNPDNIQLEAFIDGHTSREDHDKYPEQTTRSIPLVAGQWYYFEMHNIEGGGGDHMALWWKTSFTSMTEWTFVSSQYIADVGCLDTTCPERGTACDDGNAATSDDQEDGHCNCVGIPETSNSCVGERSYIEAYYYDHIPGGDLEDLYEDPNFPGMPVRYELLEMLGIESRNEADSFGTLIQGFLTVPVTGLYEFNITSNSEGIFFLSSNDDPVFKQSHQILTTSSTGTTEHDKFIFQSTAPLNLIKDQYYYFEINHKESSWTEHYSIFWKTPFYQDDQWKRIPSIYLYDYTCEIACIPQGTPCDDLDPFTNDDAFDDNCNCVGIPCTGMDCDDPIASYVPYPECGLTDRVDNRADASWLSCQKTANPNAIHGNTHWLLYDLGIEHKLYASHIWNYNVSGAVTEGFESVIIDYSMDGTNWTNLGSYNWPLATGDSEYSGFIGPDFGGIRAQYILVTSTDNTGACRGISKMSFNTQECGPEGSPCDDGDPTTVADVFDNDCNCSGRVTSFNDCGQDSLMLGDSILSLDKYVAIQFLQSSSTIQNASTVEFMASQEIILNPGFEGEQGALLTIKVDDCTQVQQLNQGPILKNLKDQLESDQLIIMPIEESDEQVIGFYIPEKGLVKLEVVDLKGQVVSELVNHEFRNPGYFTKRIRTKRLEQNRYEVRMTTQKSHVRKELKKNNY